MEGRKAIRWAVAAFLFLTAFFLLSSLPLPTLKVVEGSHAERVDVPSLPQMVKLRITLREESSERNFTALKERLEEITQYLSNYSAVPSLYSYKDHDTGEVRYVLTYTVEAEMPIDEVALERILALADGLHATFIHDTEALEEAALNRSQWEPEGFVLKHEVEASCSPFRPMPIYKGPAVEELSIIPKEEELTCTVLHRYQAVKVDWKTVYQLLQPLIPG